MIWADDTFPYNKYKSKEQLFETFATEEYEDEEYANIQWQVDYSKELGMYRITRFKNGHWNGDLIFDEYEKEN